jgi:hypothetical protein
VLIGRENIQLASSSRRQMQTACWRALRPRPG